MIDLAKFTGETLVKLNLVTLDPDIPGLDAMRLGRHIFGEADLRGWPEGWYEDPSILSDEQKSGRRGGP